MFDTLFTRNADRERHRSGPFLAERERYLRHCADQGGALGTLRTRAWVLAWVAARLSPDDRYGVDEARLRELVQGTPSPAPATAGTLVNFARPWLKFLGWWRSEQPEVPFEHEFQRFVSWMRDERGLTASTVEQWSAKVSSA